MLTLKLAHELKARGHEILVVAADPPDTDARYAEGPEEEEFEYEGIPVHVMGERLRLTGYRFDWEYRHPAMRARFAAVIDRFEPDLVHVMHAQNLSASIIEEARERGLRVILSPTDFWFICPVVQLKRPDGAVCDGPGPGARKCLTCYTPKLLPPASQVEEAFSKRSRSLGRLLALGLAGRLASALLYRLYLAMKSPDAARATVERPGVLVPVANSVQAILVPTRLMKRLMVANGIAEKLIHHVPFGIDTDELERHQEKKPSETLRIGYVGTLFEHKGVDILIRAFQRLPEGADAELKIYGGCDQFPAYADELKALAASRKHAADKIRFLGTFANHLFSEIMSEVDVLVVPSRWYENTPLVMQSALATRTPIIATDLGGMAELIDDGRSGYVFALNDDEDLGGKLAAIYHDRSILAGWRKNIGKQRTVKEMVDDIEKLYFEVGASGSGRLERAASEALLKVDVAAPADKDSLRSAGGGGD